MSNAQGLQIIRDRVRARNSACADNGQNDRRRKRPRQQQDLEADDAILERSSNDIDERLGERDLVERKMDEYLCPLVGDLPAHVAGAHEFRRKLAENPKFSDFLPAEVLQLVNHRPAHAVEVNLMIEECSQRITDEDTEGLLEIVASTIGTRETPAG